MTPHENVLWISFNPQPTSLDSSKGNSSVLVTIPLPWKCQTFGPYGEIKSSSADLSWQPDQVGFLMSDTGLENGLGEANMSGWGEKNKRKKRALVQASSGRNWSYQLFVLANIQHTKIQHSSYQDLPQQRAYVKHSRKAKGCHCTSESSP